MQQLIEMRIVGQFFQRSPVLFAALFPQFFANRGEIQFVLAQCQIFRLVFMLVILSVVCLVALRGLQDAEFFVVCLIAHIVR